MRIAAIRVLVRTSMTVSVPPCSSETYRSKSVQSLRFLLHFITLHQDNRGDGLTAPECRLDANGAVAGICLESALNRLGERSLGLRHRQTLLFGFLEIMP